MNEIHFIIRVKFCFLIEQAPKVRDTLLMLNLIAALGLITHATFAQTPKPADSFVKLNGVKHSEYTADLDILHQKIMEVEKQRDEVIITKRRALQDKIRKERYANEARYLEAVKTAPSQEKNKLKRGIRINS